ncbi:MAG TPA: noncanonical pyrimidine nucleotidase, YjjG family, partial [Aquaticitalea sp.]|nr:noncanonical pyrimidine nucleotidase, YjjG family [Aquaticitalea sp.]
MKLKGIKHIFFDLDHTLWDFDRNSALAFERIFEIHMMDIDLERFLGFYEPINFHYWKMYRNSEVDKEQLRYGRLKDTFDLMGM